MQLRPYQEKAIDLLTEKIKEGKRKIVLVIGCGGGKTNIACEIIRRGVKRGNKTVFLAHRRELVTQCRDRLKLYNISGSLILGGHKRDYTNIVQIASVQSLLRNELPPCKIVFVDECHTSTSDGYKELIEQYHSQGSVIIGLTATPFRTDKKGLGLIYEDYVQPIMNSELVAQKAVLPTKVYGSGGISSKKFKKKMGEYVAEDVLKAFDTDKVYINLINNYRHFADNLQTIVFCQNVEHSIKTRDCFREYGYTAEHIDAETSDEERDRIIKEYREGKITILTNYGILAEGFDVPSTKAVIMNCATTSRIKWIQACGRCQRLDGVKTFGIVIDMADNWKRFGQPEDDIIVELHPPERKVKGEGVAPVSLCGQCYFIMSNKAQVCPECGWVKPKKSAKQIKEELFVELTKKEQKEILKKEADEIDQANIRLNEDVWRNFKREDWPKVPRELLKAFAKYKGYNHSWVYLQMKQRGFIR